MAGAGGPTLDEVVSAGAEGAAPPSLPPVGGGVQGFDLMSLLRTPTGAGEVADYKDHPLNPVPNTEHGNRIARGVAGFTGGARWAVFDIILGIVGWVRAAAAKLRPGGAA